MCLFVGKFEEGEDGDQEIRDDKETKHLWPTHTVCQTSKPNK